MAPTWGKIDLEQIARILGGRLIGLGQRSLVNGISTDSRTIRPGQLFWALEGERFDGHDFVLEALSKGACGAVVREGYLSGDIELEGPALIGVPDTLEALGRLAQWWRKECKDTRLAAVTGSAGKTTTKEMAAAILGIRHEILKTQGNLNNLIGLPLTILGLEDRHARAVIEMGMNRPGEIARLTQISDPDVGVITNVGRAHLEGVGTLEGVARAKLEMAHEMRAQAPLVLNGDDFTLMEHASSIKREMLTFGLGQGNWIRAGSIEDLGLDGTRFRIHVDGREMDVRLRVPGLQNIYNALAAAALCLLLGEDLDNISQGLEGYGGLKGRFQVKKIPPGVTLVDDTYNSNPLSLKRAFECITTTAGDSSRVIVVLGDMLELGEHSVSAHREAGAWVARLGPRLAIFTGAFAREFKRGAVEEGMDPQRVRIEDSHHEIVRSVTGELKQGDLIFLKASRLVGLDRVVELLERG